MPRRIPTCARLCLTGPLTISLMIAIGAAAADIRLPAIISSHMVLQQQTEAPLWGWARPGATVRIKAQWLKDETAAVAGQDGAWRARVHTPQAGGPYTITVTGEETVTLEDVLIGEVWLCGGQSNMEWSVGPVGWAGPGVENRAEVIQAASYPNIRLFDVKNTVALAPATDCVGTWAACSPETVPAFSAIGYFFGRTLHNELNVPIGLIGSNWGGTPAEAWTSAEALRGRPELAARFGDELAAVAKQHADPDRARADQAQALVKWWHQIEAADAQAQTEGWTRADCDDSAWETMTLPTTWGGTLASFDGIVWFRRAVDVPAAWADRDLTLELGPIDDVDDTFVNGTCLGGLHGQGDWATPRKYAVPAALVKPGRNVVAVRVLDTGGLGGINGKPEQMRLYPAGTDDSAVLSLAGQWRYHVGPAATQLPPRPRVTMIGPNTPTTLYNGMIAPLVPFALRGVIWYQGESNRGEARLYRTLFPALIADWRRAWGERDFPVYYVQIAPYAYAGDVGESGELREAQLLALATPNTGMAVTMDIGNPQNIHPGHKDEVARRLSLWALAKTYGRPDIVYSGPLFKSMASEGNRIRLSFDYVDGGLVARDGGPLTHFVIAGDDRKFVLATAVIDGDTVVVSSDAVPKPVAVRYAWGTADEPNLANGAGLPASSFRTDDWERVEVGPPRRTWVKPEVTATGPARLVLTAPIEHWDEAVPLGNGLTGGLLWGGGNQINLSLDRGDLWDLRTPDVFRREDWTYATLRQLQAAGDQAKLTELFDTPYEVIPYPTKIPAGRLELTLADSQRAQAFTLDLASAEGWVELGGPRVECFYSAVSPVALLRIPGRPAALKLVAPAALSKLGYAAAVEGHDGTVQWFVQEAAQGLRYAVVVGSREHAGATELAVAITSTNDGPDPLAIGRARAMQALEAGYEQLRGPHRAWWQRFWSTSGVHVPDEALQNHYDLVKYFHGAASRADAPPMPLQGVWTADDGNLPPWKGDFHNDLNTQMTYLAYHTAGLVDAGESFLNLNWTLRPAYRQFARRFYGLPGMVVPGVMALDGQPLGGWEQYSLSPTMGAWVAQSFYLHWRYTMDQTFLKERAYPWCAEIGSALRALLQPDEQEQLKLPLSSSPEFFDNSMRAWLPPNSNFDLALLRWLFRALSEMAEAVGLRDAAFDWEQALLQLDDLDVDAQTNALTVARGIPYSESHRHFSHVLAIHPLGILDIETGQRERATIRASVDQILEKGTSQWCGYSFSWMACLLARCGRAEDARQYLETYERAFTLRNGFHANGDQTHSGLSQFTYRPFTLEGNFLAMEAVHEMLLQSWGGLVRVFPAVSEKWADVAFEDLRAQGAFRISAQRKAGRTEFVSITADCDGPLRLRDPFDGQRATWNRDDLRRAGTKLEVQMKKGDVLIGRREEVHGGQ